MQRISILGGALLLALSVAPPVPAQKRLHGQVAIDPVAGTTTFTLNAEGDPSTFCILFADRKLGGPTATPIGDLYLNPFTMVFVNVVALDANGIGSMTAARTLASWGNTSIAMQGLFWDPAAMVAKLSGPVVLGHRHDAAAGDVYAAIAHDFPPGGGNYKIRVYLSDREGENLRIRVVPAGAGAIVVSDMRVPTKPYASHWSANKLDLGVLVPLVAPDHRLEIKLGAAAAFDLLRG